MKGHPVDFLQAVNEIPETNFVTNNQNTTTTPGSNAVAAAQSNNLNAAMNPNNLAVRQPPDLVDPLSQTQFLVKLAEHNLLDRKIHGRMLPYGQFPKNAGYQHGCLDTVRSTDRSHYV